MFSILGQATRLCDGLSRREMLRVGGLSALGLSLPSLLRAGTARAGAIADPTFGRAENLIYIWLQGGPPQHETFDPKPAAPAEIRGPFQPIQTNVPGIEFCELLPRTARIADKLAVIRSMATDSNIHSVSAYEVLTGNKYRGSNARQIDTNDWPYFGSLVKRLRPSEKLPALSTAWLPDVMRLNENVMPAGQTAGFLGRRWEPDRFVGDPSDPDYQVDGLERGHVSPLRLSHRMALLEQVQQHFDRWERGGGPGAFDQYQQQAYDLLSSGIVQQAFRVRDEPETVRTRYGRNQWGQCLLLARRLVEVGVRLVHVNWSREPGDSAVDNPMWDTHAQNPDRLEDALCPIFDVGFTALVEDLAERGLLETTMVIAIGEFGRTPKINSKAGRDHWGAVFSFAMAGAGVQTGQVYGASDPIGAYPASDRVTPADLTATIFHALGIPHDGNFDDAQGRQHQLTTGTPLHAILGSTPTASALVEPGGNVARVPPYTQALLLHGSFTDSVDLLAANHGSRPKGWRAAPLLEVDQASGLGVWLGDRQAAASSSDQAFAALGWRMEADGKALNLAPDSHAILAQEMRNPRLGLFRLRIRATGRASSRLLWDDVVLPHFQFRLVIFRYRDSAKNPEQREEFISRPFVPMYRAEEIGQSGDSDAETFEVEKLLDSPAAGQNFPIGNGFGVAIVMERTTPDVLRILASSAAQYAHLQIEEVQLDFRSRTINEQVQV